MSDASELRYLATHEWGRIDEEGILLKKNCTISLLLCLL